VTSALPERLIAHLDMDAFYASVELARRPGLRGQAVVVGGRRSAPADAPEGAPLSGYVGRGVVTTATYEARAFGVHSGMGLMKAAVLAPHAVLLPADFDEYRRVSRLFKAAVAELAPAIEDRGIDEIYIDLSDAPGVRDAVGHDPLGGLRAFARDLKNNVRAATGLSCSIGVSPNKLLSKIASDLDKPDGLTVVMPEDIPTRIWRLPVGRIHGVGPKASARLVELGVQTIGDLAGRPLDWLVEHFGVHHGAWLLDAAHGRDDRPVVRQSEPVSISRETTFDHDLHPRNDRARLSDIFTTLCLRVGDDLVRKGYVGRTVGIKLRFDDFRTVTRDLTIAEPTDDGAAIRAAAGQCLKRITLSRRIRLLGVRVGNLSRPGAAAPVVAVKPATTASSAGKGEPARPAPRSARAATADAYSLPLFDDDPAASDA
jgi:DNA polymerase-4